MAMMSDLWVYLLLYSAGHLATVTDCSPVNLPSLPAIVNIPESAALGTGIHTVAPSGGNSSYICYVGLQDPDNSTRRFGFTSFDVETIMTLDYENITQFILTLKCEDNSTNTKTGSGTLTVSLVDVNDHYPVISGGLNVSIPEETSVGSVLTGLYSAVDGDATDILTYSLVGGDTGYFQVNVATGSIRVVSRLDRDPPGARVVFDDLLVTVTDRWGVSATASLTVSITDINDNTPRFSPAVYYVTATENKSPGEVLVTLVCQDPDESPGNGDITYSLVSGDDTPPKFNLSANNLLTTTTPVDYDVLSAQGFLYQLIVTATDGGVTPNTGTATVFVQVLSENDESPVWGNFTPAFVDSTSPYNVNENVLIGTTVVTLTASDADEGVDGIITYSIVSITVDGGSTASNVLRVEPVSGVLMTSVQLDRDPPLGVLYYDVNVLATDHGTPARSVDRTIRVGLTDVNDNKPTFPSSHYQISVAEDTAADASVLGLMASDQDTVSNLTYSIISGNEGSKFKLSGSELQVLAAVNLDAPDNHPDSYNLVVMVVDGGTPELTGSTTVAVTITARNDHDPVFTGLANNYTFLENTMIGSIVTTLSATDQDFGTDGTISYSILSGGLGNFHLNSLTGVLKLIKVIDYETVGNGGVLEVVTVATDGGGQTDTATVTVVVTDANDNSPVCVSTFYTLSLPESVFNGTGSMQVLNLACSDTDVSAILTYTILSGDITSSFSVSSTGQLHLEQELDYESVTYYRLAVEVSDGLYSEDVEIAVSVLPVNEWFPILFTPVLNLTVTEDTPIGTPLATYTATDMDSGPDGVISYAISTVSQSGGDLFEVDSSQGIIILIKQLDYEELPASEKYYTLVLVATDQSGFQAPGTVSIFVSDINDNSPACIPPYRGISQPENTVVGDLPLTLVTSLGCSDLDPGSSGSLSYTLSQTPGGTQFGVDSSTGTITLNNALDYESEDSFLLAIVAADDWGINSRSFTVTVAVSVTNLNDGGPVFVGSNTATVFESATIGEIVCDTGVVDPDDPNTPEGRLVYSIVDGDNLNQFHINKDTGRITVRNKLDREINMFYILQVQVEEEGGYFSALSNINLTIANVNDNPPNCPSRIINLHVNESAPVGEVLLTLNCPDVDSTSVSYSMTSGDTAVFEVSDSDLKLKAALDYDLATRLYDLTVSAFDGSLQTDVYITVHILPVNEYTPTFTQSGVYSVSVDEDLALGSLLIQVTASDSDSELDGQVHFSMTPHPSFHLETKTGRLTLKQHLDYETSSSYNLVVTASDLGMPPDTSTAVVDITVVDVNDNTPVFTPRFYKGSVVENSVAESTILTLTCVDGDSGSYGDLTYSLDSAGNVGNVFRVDKNSNSECSLIVDDESNLNYDMITWYELVVVATDGGGLVSEAYMSIQVNPMNEFAPVFLPSSSSTEVVPEDSPVHTLVLDFLATDSDSGPDGSVTYTIESGAQNKFIIDSVTGELFLTGKLDRESVSLYRMDVVAYDGGINPSAFSSTYSLSVQVSDVNDRAPVCSSTGFNIYISESTPPSTSVSRVNCTDSDADSPNNQLVYSLTGGNGSSLFDIDPSGVIFTGNDTVLDRETITTYSLTILISDNGTPSLSTSAQVLLIITDENDNSPVFCCSPYTAVIGEDIALQTLVIQVAATDLDEKPAGTIVYTISSGNVGNKFAIDGVTAEIRTVTGLDREGTPVYEIVVEATDQGILQNTATATVSINLTDRNDNIPSCTSSVYHGVIPETATPTQTVLSLSCTDADEGINADLTYSVFTSGSPFDINPTTGVVFLSTSLSPPVASSYHLIVRVSDLTFSVNVTVVVGVYFEEASPLFSPAGPYSVSIPETEIKGVIVTQLNATDSNSTHPLIFSITGGNTGNHFSVSPITGIIQTQNTIDYETIPEYELKVTVTDLTSSGLLSSTTTVTVTVLDVDDNPPACVPDKYSESVAETYSGSIVTVTCTDIDTASVVIYSIVSGNIYNTFSVDTNTGELTVGNLDYENVTMYDLAIQASDGTLSTMVFVCLTVEAVNEHDPVFTTPSYPANIVEDSAVTTSVLTVTATDEDSGNHGVVMYAIVSGNSEQKFTVDKRSGIISVIKPLDREQTGSYSLSVRAIDSLGELPSARETDVLVHITVEDSNDNFPVFNPVTYHMSVLESAASGSSLVLLSATDDDEGENSNISFTIVDGNADGIFSISANALEISVGKNLDYETKLFHSLVVKASDNGTEPREALARVSVTVLAVNEFIPVQAVNSTVLIPEDILVGTVIFTVTSNDTDVSSFGNTLAYSIISGNSGSPFIIDPITGHIQVWSIQDFDTPPLTYFLEILVEDDGGTTGVLSSTTSLSVILVDVNDERPVFTANAYTFTISENITGSTSIGSVNASDADSSTNGEITYSIISGENTLFFVDNITGAVSTTMSAALDYENKTKFSLRIRGTDGGSPPLYSDCIVYIKLTDINDNTPEFIFSSFNVSVYEDVFIGAEVVSVHAEDLDSGNNGLISYSLSPAEFFNVNPSTGIITTSTHLERELNDTHVLIVVGSDLGNPPLTGTCTVTVIILDINDNVPVINGTYNISVPEDTSPGTIITQVVATDQDIKENAEFLFTLDSGNTNNTWDVESHSGMIRLVRSLDRELLDSYYLVVTVHDNGYPTHSASQTVSIIVSDVNDNSPIFIQSDYHFELEENVPFGSFAGRILAVDADTGANADIRYQLLSINTGNDDFSIDSATGDITATGNIDRESIDNYIFRYLATDQGTPKRYDETIVNITVSDLNDNAPLFSMSHYSGSVFENAFNATIVLNVSVADVDLAVVSSTFTLLIESTSPGGTLADQCFFINTTSAVLSTRSSLDSEAQDIYEFEIIAVDHGTPALSSSAGVTVYVTDVNDNPPAMDRLFESVEIDYRGDCTGEITTVTASDPDQISSTLSYTFNQTTSVFSIGETTGKVWLLTEGEQNHTYLLEVLVSDNGEPEFNSTEPMILRIDSLDLQSSVISFVLSISREYFMTNEEVFLQQLTSVYQGTYPSCLAKRWCLDDLDGSATDPGSRRRLLATGDSPVMVHVYILADNVTDSSDNTGEVKNILPVTEALSYLVDDFDGTLLSAISGGVWSNFGIFQVKAYIEVPLPPVLPLDPVLIGLSVLGALSFLILSALILYCSIKPKQQTYAPSTEKFPTPDHEDVVETVDEGLQMEHEYPLEKTVMMAHPVGDMSGLVGPQKPRSPGVFKKFGHDDIVVGPAPDKYLLDALLRAERDSSRFTSKAGLQEKFKPQVKSLSSLSLSQLINEGVNAETVPPPPATDKRRPQKVHSEGAQKTETPTIPLKRQTQQEQPMREEKVYQPNSAPRTEKGINLEEDKSSEERASTETEEESEPEETVSKLDGLPASQTPAEEEKSAESSETSEDESAEPDTGEFDGEAVDQETGQVYEFNSVTYETRWKDTPEELEPSPKNTADATIYDETAVDSDTGQMYEYNSVTMETRWMTTPEGDPIMAKNDQPNEQEGKESGKEQVSVIDTFDLMAVDKETGRMYEYSSATGETRWMTTSDGKPILTDVFKQMTPKDTIPKVSSDKEATQIAETQDVERKSEDEMEQTDEKKLEEKSAEEPVKTQSISKPSSLRNSVGSIGFVRSDNKLSRTSQQVSSARNSVASVRSKGLHIELERDELNQSSASGGESANEAPGKTERASDTMGEADNMSEAPRITDTRAADTSEALSEADTMSEAPVEAGTSDADTMSEVAEKVDTRSKAPVKADILREAINEVDTTSEGTSEADTMSEVAKEVEAKSKAPVKADILREAINEVDTTSEGTSEADTMSEVAKEVDTKSKAPVKADILREAINEVDTTSEGTSEADTMSEVAKEVETKSKAPVKADILREAINEVDTTSEGTSEADTMSEVAKEVETKSKAPVKADILREAINEVDTTSEGTSEADTMSEVAKEVETKSKAPVKADILREAINEVDTTSEGTSETDEVSEAPSDVVSSSSSASESDNRPVDTGEDSESSSPSSTPSRRDSTGSTSSVSSEEKSRRTEAESEAESNQSGSSERVSGTEADSETESSSGSEEDRKKSDVSSGESESSEAREQTSGNPRRIEEKSPATSGEEEDSEESSSSN